MKNILFTILICIACVPLTLKANSCCSGKLNISFESTYIVTPLTGNLSLNFEVKYNDSTQPHIDSIWYFIPRNEGISILSNTLPTGNYSGDTVQSHSLGISFDIQNQPFYLKELRVYVKVDGKVDLNIVYLYFTPWDSIQIYNPYTLSQDNRNWVVQSDSVTPVRVYIDPDTLPSSLDTTLPICWVQYDGLAYEIPVNCDTTTASPPSGSQGALNLWKQFEGKVKGRLIYPYFNENNALVNIPIVGAQVTVSKESGGSKILVIGYTDSEGNFDLDYDKTFWNTTGNIKIKVAIRSWGIDVVVHRPPSDLLPFGLSTPKRNHNHSGGKKTFDFGTMSAPQNTNMHIFHWAKRAYTFAKNELSGWNVPWGVLDIEAPRNPSNLGRKCFFSSSSLPQGKIFMQTAACLTNESITYHEVGHFVQYAIQNRKFQPDAGGTHGLFRNNTHPNQTITEGFANAFAMLVDAYYFEDDNEASMFDRIEVHSTVNLAPDVHTIVNEFKFAQMVLDLWDGVTKFNGFGMNLSLINENRIRDVEGNAILDQVTLSTKDVFRPFYNNRSSDAATIQGVARYMNEITDYFNSCDMSRKIGRLSQMNFGRNNTYTGFGEHFNINTDVIAREFFTQHQDDDLGVDAAGFLTVGTATPYSYNYTYAGNSEVDVESINTQTGSFNYTSINSPIGQLTDNLLIENGADLLFNNNSPIYWVNFNNPFRPLINSNFQVNVCGIEIEIEDNSSLIVGDPNGTTKAELFIGNGSSLLLRDGAELVINDNSRLIVEDGAELKFEEGASIVLVGDNAVLEINGKLIIGEDAIFTFTGEGFLRTNFYNCLNCDNIIAGENSEIRLQGVGPNDKILEVLDNTNFEAGFETVKFTLLDGKVELGENSVLHTRNADPDFQNLTITAIDPNKPFNQVMLNGKPIHTFSNIDISYANYGINDRQIYGGGSLKLTNVNITHCNAGLRTLGVGAELIGCDFTDNYFGWEVVTSGFGFQSKVSNSTFTNNTVGLYFNSTGGNLKLIKSSLSSNQLGVNFRGNGILSGSCSNIDNNSSSGISTGWNAVLDFDQSSRMSVSFNSVDNIRLSLIRGLYLNNGRNYFEAASGLTNGVFTGIVDGTSPSFMGISSIPAHKNQWKSPNGSPISGVDYSIGSNVSPTNLLLVDNSPEIFNSLECESFIHAPCGSLAEPCLVADPLLYCPLCPVIQTPNFVSIPLNQAINSVLDSVYTEIPNNNQSSYYLTAISLFHEILSYQIADTSSEVLYLTEYAYNEMKKVFSFAVESNLISKSAVDNTPTINPYTQLLISIMDDRAIVDGDAHNQYKEKLFHRIDKALLYRSINRRADAIIQLDDILTYTVGDDYYQVTELRCETFAEKQLLDESITYDQFETTIQNCANGNPFLRKKSILKDEVLNNVIFDISPNPSNGAFTISGINILGNQLDLEIHNTKGQLVFRKQLQVIDNKVSKEISLEYLQRGLYLIRIKSNTEIITKKIILQ